MDEDFETAAAHYTAAVAASGPSGPPCSLLVHRAAALHKLGRLLESVDDANAALRAAASPAEQCLAQYRRGYVSAVSVALPLTHPPSVGVPLPLAGSA